MHARLCSQVEEVQAICAANYSYTPEEYWSSITEEARDFIDHCLVVDSQKRLTAIGALKHPWVQGDNMDRLSGEENLLNKGLKDKFDAKKVCIMSAILSKGNDKSGFRHGGKRSSRHVSLTQPTRAQNRIPWDILLLMSTIL